MTHHHSSSRHLLAACAALLCLSPLPARAQLVQTGGHYGGQASDTGFAGEVTTSGGYTASVPLDLPEARGGLPVPVAVTYTGRGMGAAGVGWDIPLSFVRRDRLIGHRRPLGQFVDESRERAVLTLGGQEIDLVAQDVPATTWIGRRDGVQLILRQDGGNWHAYDGSGHTFTFTNQWHGVDLGSFALLEDVSGPGSGRVELDYDVRILDVAGDHSDSGLVINPTRVSFNSHVAQPSCFKNEVLFTYYPEASQPLSLTAVGFAFLVRTATLHTVDVYAHATCNDTTLLRSHVFQYVPDGDTGLPRLQSVQMTGQSGTDEEHTVIPLTAYTYGRATTHDDASGTDRLIYTRTQNIPTPSIPSGTIAQTQAVEPALTLLSTGYATTYMLIDVTGDGRPDYVFNNPGDGGTLWWSPNLSTGVGGGVTFGAGGRLASPPGDSTSALEERDLMSARFNYVTGRTPPPIIGLDGNMDEVWRQVIDFNGDGRLDVVDALGAGPGKWKVWLNTPRGAVDGDDGSQPEWVPREVNVTGIMQELRNRGYQIRSDYLSVSRRATRPLVSRYQCWQLVSNGPGGPVYQPWVNPLRLPCHGPVDDFTIKNEYTYIEWQMKDVNGDGYPDFVYTSAPIGISQTPHYPVNIPNPLPDGSRIGDGTIDDVLGYPGDNAVMVRYNIAGAQLPVAAGSGDFVQLGLPFRFQQNCGVEQWVGDLVGQTLVQRQACGIQDVNGDGLADRVEGTTVYLNMGGLFPSTVTMTLPGRLGLTANPQPNVCHLFGAGPGTTFTTVDTAALRDVTGDGIPDYVFGNGVSIGTGTGFRPPVEMQTSDGHAVDPESAEVERCDGGISKAQSGLWDIDGDGKADVLVRNGGGIDVYQLQAGTAARTPEAGLLVEIDSGLGARTLVTYGSAKEDPTTLHQVPSAEIVATRVETQGPKPQGPGQPTQLVEATTHAYGGVSTMYDSAQDRWVSTGYQRAVTLQAGLATLHDSYPLAPANLQASADDRYGRYLRVGLPKDDAVLSNAGADAWALLGTDISTSGSVIAHTHYDWGTRRFAGPTAQQGYCVDLAYPYSWELDGGGGGAPSLDPCAAYGFAFLSAMDNQRGLGATDTNQTQTHLQVDAVDDFGRYLSVTNRNDSNVSDDDVCTTTTYAGVQTLDPLAAAPRVLSSPSTRTVTNCAGLTLLGETFEHAGAPSGLVENAVVTGYSVDNYRLTSGTAVGTVRLFDATYDDAGNLATMTTSRPDGDRTLARTQTVDYDVFGLAPTAMRLTATDVGDMRVDFDRDPLTLALLGTTDLNRTRRGTLFDGFGRPRMSTVTPPGGAPGALECTRYVGFDGSQAPQIVGTSYNDPVPVDLAHPLAACDTPGRTATALLDELGRTKETQLQLGDNYDGEVLVAGHREYDSLGRVAFEADPYPLSQVAPPYGTSRFFNPDGTPACFIRANGRQPRPQDFTQVKSDESSEYYPTCFNRRFFNHLELRYVQAADSLLTGSPQAGVKQLTQLSAIGRVVARYTQTATQVLDLISFQYDGLGNLSQMSRLAASNAIDPVTRWKYDSLGRIVELDDGQNAQFRTYSAWGDLLEETWTDTAVRPAVVHRSTMRYDGLGRLTHREELSNGTTDPETVNDYAYDSLPSTPLDIDAENLVGRLAQASYPTGSVTMSYDALGHVATRTFLSNDADEAGHEYVEHRVFDGDGLLRELHFLLPDTGNLDERIEYEYDSARRLLAVTAVDGLTREPLYEATVIDAFGRVREANIGAAIEYAAAYADLGRRLPQEVTVTAPPMAVHDIVYGVADPVGRERNRDETVGTDVTHITFAYGLYGRLLTSQTTLNGQLTSSNDFSFDTLGNLLKMHDAKTSGLNDVALGYPTASSTLKDADKVCRIDYGRTTPSSTTCNVTYDGAGSILSLPTRSHGLRQLTYGADGRVRTINEAGNTAHFQYDAFGEVQELDVEGASLSLGRHDRRFGEHIERRDVTDGGGPTQIIRKVPGPDGMIATRRGAGGAWVFPFAEDRGSRFFADASGAIVQSVDYRPFGQSTPKGSAAPGSSLYSREQWNGGDALEAFGLVHLGARLYDPAIGRFLGRDPAIAPRTGASTNPYAFVDNDPINHSDPTGESCQEGYGPCDSADDELDKVYTNGHEAWNAFRDYFIPRANLAMHEFREVNDRLRDQMGRWEYAAKMDYFDAGNRDAMGAEYREKWMRASLFRTILSVPGDLRMHAIVRAGVEPMTLRSMSEKALEIARFNSFVEPTFWAVAGAAAAKYASEGTGGGRSGLPRSAARDAIVNCFAAGTPVAVPGGAVPIESLELGDRVEAGDARCAAEHMPADTVTIEVEVANAERPDEVTIARLARPRSWLDEAGLGSGDVYLDETVDGLDGWAHLRSVGPAPREQAGDGCLVMMTASHVARELVTLRLDTGTELDLTPQHLLFFEEMGWMPAGLAEPGWTLRADLGPVRVAAVDRGIPFRRVYNIEVGLAHTFRVSRERVVTHNGSSPIGGRDFEAEFQRIQAGRAALRPQRSALRAQAGVGAGPRSMEPIGERASRLDRDFGIRANVKLGSSTYGNDLFPAEDPWAGQATPTVDYDGEP